VHLMKEYWLAWRWEQSLHQAGRAGRAGGLLDLKYRKVGKAFEDILDWQICSRLWV
jgi:hypothetical protein